MDKLEFYSLLTGYADIPIANGAINCYTVFDTQQDHYQVMNIVNKVKTQ